MSSRGNPRRKPASDKQRKQWQSVDTYIASETVADTAAKTWVRKVN